MTNTSYSATAFRVLSTVLAAIFLTAQVATANAPGPDGNRGHLNRLLHDERVIAYLGLTEDQARTAQAISDDVVERYREEFEIALAPFSREERVPLVRTVFYDVNEDTFEGLERVISAEQLQRLRQIEIQTFGVRAFARPSVIAHLGLTEEQSRQLGEIGNAMGRELQAIARSSDLSESERAAAAAPVRATALEQVRQRLQPEQWVKWELLVGAAFGEQDG